MKVRIAITGTLSKPRGQIIELIETRTNAVYDSKVAAWTDYLVASRKDSAKAQAATERGVLVLTEAELLAYIEAGHIPPRLAYPRAEMRNPEEAKAFFQKVSLLLSFVPVDALHAGEWDITWSEVLNPPRTVVLDYEGFDGARSHRTAVISQRGKRSDGAVYWGITDSEGFKMFREDRIVDFRLADVASDSQMPIRRDPKMHTQWAF